MPKPKPPETKKWRRIKGPRNWAPKAGDEIVGKYGGRTLRHGQFGQYEVILVHTEDQVYVVSGVMIIQAVDTALLEKGDIVRIVFQGYKQLRDADWKMKVFDLYVPE